MTQSALPTINQIINKWEAIISPAQEDEWAQTYCVYFTVQLLEEFKVRSDSYVLSDKPSKANQVLRAMEIVLHCLSDEPLAAVYVAWAQGNATLYHDPAQATAHYQQALAVCRQLNKAQFVVRLLGNLLGALCEVGNFAAAQETYEEISVWKRKLEQEDLIFLLVPAQNYALYLDYIGKYQQALESHQYALQLALESNDERRVVEINTNYAQTLARLGRLDESEQLLLKMRSKAKKLEDILTATRIDMNLGTIYSAQSRPADALHSLYLAQKGFNSLKNKMEVGSVLLREAEVLIRIGAFQEAGRCYHQAQEQFFGYSMSPEVGLALLGGAIAYRLYGYLDRAYLLLQDAKELWENLNQPDHLLWIQLEEIALTLAKGNAVTALNQLQNCLIQPLEQKEYPHHLIRYWWLKAETYAALWQVDANINFFAQAHDAYQKTLTISETFRHRETWRDALVGLAKLLLDRDPHQAHELLRKAQTQDDLIRQALSVQELKASFLRRANEVTPLLMKLAIDKQAPDEALLHAWHAKGIALIELMNAAQMIRRKASTEETALDQELQEVRHQLATLRWQTRATQSFHLPEVDGERQQPQIQRLTDQLQTLRRRRNSQFDNDLLKKLDSPATILQSMTADILIEYVCCDESIWAICADSDGNRDVCKLADVDTIYDLQEELLLTFGNVLEQPWPLPQSQITLLLDECNPLLAQCYDLLLAPLELFSVQTHLLISPCESVFGLPFAAFRCQEQYLVEKHKINFIPTGALLALPAQTPLYARPIVVAASAAGQLDAIQVEVDTIKKFFMETQVFIDTPNVVHKLLQMDEPPYFLHIAAHTTSSDYPLQTAFHMTDELLTVETCADLNLEGTSFVNLSGCNTGGDLTNQELLLAWQSAFLIAGAQCVISTLWPIADAATATFMHHFYELVAAHVNPLTALHRTQRKLLADPHYCHPVFWAPFVAYRR